MFQHCGSGLHAWGRALTGDAFFQQPRCHTSLEKPKHFTANWEDMIPSPSRDLQGFPGTSTATGTYPSASSIGSGGAWREADGRTVLVPRDTLSCSVFADREAMEMG